MTCGLLEFVGYSTCGLIVILRYLRFTWFLALPVAYMSSWATCGLHEFLGYLWLTCLPGLPVANLSSVQQASIEGERLLAFCAFSGERFYSCISRWLCVAITWKPKGTFFYPSVDQLPAGW